jgi:lipopolysaccharide/colanic/teichoic acid biosynthesis glycosyltransferase
MTRILLKGLLNKSLRRLFDIVFALCGLILLLPVFLILAIWIKLDSTGPVLYKQVRVGKKLKDFWLVKFRSMRTDADRGRLITVGNRDARITRAGYFIRKYKLDELPQLWNVLKGDMSIVGPRPEVRKYVELYTPQQKMILFSVRPGITDFATIEYADENTILSKVNDPEAFYISDVMPAKIKLNTIFIENPTFTNYIRIIFRTIKKLFIS